MFYELIAFNSYYFTAEQRLEFWFTYENIETLIQSTAKAN